MNGGLAGKTAVVTGTAHAFHGTVLGSGAVPLGVLEQLVSQWVEQQPPRS